MSRFQFRLDTLQRLRSAERDERRADLAKAFAAEALLRQRMAELEAEQAGLQQAARARSSPGSADVDSLMRTHRYRLVLKAQQQQLAAQMAQVAAEVERRRQALVEADRQVRVLEKLRERQAARHRAGEERREVKVYDELAALGHLRRAEATA
jgi:flagellar FliJ protein